MAELIIWAPLAKEDLENILKYLNENWDAQMVIQFLDKIDHITHQITNNPYQYPLINKDLRIRKCVVTKHNILFYRSHNKTIQILRLFDIRQNPDNLKFE
ncbi:MAG: type II toxin-antitoxin system RelE/ParE family toxin [Bacteroidales bacterium]